MDLIAVHGMQLESQQFSPVRALFQSGGQSTIGRIALQTGANGIGDLPFPRFEPQHRCQFGSGKFRMGVHEGKQGLLLFQRQHKGIALLVFYPQIIDHFPQLAHLEERRRTRRHPRTAISDTPADQGLPPLQLAPGHQMLAGFQRTLMKNDIVAKMGDHFPGEYLRIEPFLTIHDGVVFFDISRARIDPILTPECRIGGKLLVQILPHGQPLCMKFPIPSDHCLYILPLLLVLEIGLDRPVTSLLVDMTQHTPELRQRDLFGYRLGAQLPQSEGREPQSLSAVHPQTRQLLQKQSSTQLVAIIALALGSLLGPIGIFCQCTPF